MKNDGFYLVLILCCALCQKFLVSCIVFLLQIKTNTEGSRNGRDREVGDILYIYISQVQFSESPPCSRNWKIFLRVEKQFVLSSSLFRVLTTAVQQSIFNPSLLTSESSISCFLCPLPLQVLKMASHFGPEKLFSCHLFKVCLFPTVSNKE
jgi:hypothetical protein